MTSTTDKIKGAANEVAGAVKQGVGEAVGNPKLQVEGAAQKLKGQAQGAVGDAKDSGQEGRRQDLSKVQLRESGPFGPFFYWAGSGAIGERSERAI